MKSTHGLHISVFIKEARFGFEPEFLAEVLSSDIVEFIESSELIKKDDLQATVSTSDPIGDFSTMLYAVKVTCVKKTDKILNFILPKLSVKDVLFLKETIDSRIDDECNCFMRFDLTEFIENKQFVLVDHGDCLHMRIKVAAYPAKKDVALDVMKRFLDERS